MFVVAATIASKDMSLVQHLRLDIEQAIAICLAYAP